MSINNLNPRRTVWFSPREPLNKYDIWLSKNAHLDENGEPTVDSNVQRDCDYIFKIYDCGKWNPIVGFNSTAKFKINTVTNVSYEYTHNGTTHTSNSIQQFHLPLFREPKDSPAELFDAGTIGEAILEYVTEEEWGDIFNSEAFENAWETNIENIDIRPAGRQLLGGIWADGFTQSYDGDLYLAQCKYKYQSSSSRPDYNLFVHAKDIYKAISEYIEDNDVDVDIINSLFNIFENSASIIKGWHQLAEDATPLDIQANKPRFVIGGDPWTHIGNRGKFLKSRDDDGWYSTHGGEPYSVDNSCWKYVDIFDEIGGEDPTPSQERVPIKGLYGINATYRTFNDDTEGYALKLSGYDSSTGTKKYCRTVLVTAPSPSRDEIPDEWLYADESDTYMGLEWLSGADIIKDETNYNSSTMGSSTVYLKCANGVLGWSGGGDIYTAGYGIKDINTSTNIIRLFTKPIEIPSEFDSSDGILIRYRYRDDGSEACEITDDPNGHEILLRPYLYIDLSTLEDISVTFNDMESINDPVYIRLSVDSNKSFGFNGNHEVIGDYNDVTSGVSTSFLITLRFGIIKFEKIETVNTRSEESENEEPISNEP